PEELNAFMEKWRNYEALKVPMDPKDEPLILASLKKEPQGPWSHYLAMKFANAQFEARGLKGSERTAAYKATLRYLKPGLETLTVAAKAKPDDEMIRGGAANLEALVAAASLEAGLDLAPIKASTLARLAGNKDPKSWDYGNVIFDANTLLGRIALRE